MDRLRFVDAGLRAFDTHVPEVTPPLCVATRYRSSSCRSCLDVCPAGAIVTSPWLDVDTEKCSSCGACVSVCRTGALAWELQSDTLRTAVQPPGAAVTSTVVLACRRVDPGVVTDATWVMSCLGGLSAADLLAAALRTERIEFVSGDCPECPDAAAEAALDLAVATAEGTMAALGQPVDVARTRMPGSASAAETTAATVSRRGLFGFLVRGLGQATAGGVAPRDPQRSISALHRQVAPPRTHRQLILDLLELHARGDGSAVTLPRALPLASLVATSECDMCGLCLSYCPHGALEMAGDALTWAAANCTGCDLCVEVCPRSALRTGPARLTPRRPSEAGAANHPALA
jgi:ferredoxin